MLWPFEGWCGSHIIGNELPMMFKGLRLTCYLIHSVKFLTSFLPLVIEPILLTFSTIEQNPSRLICWVSKAKQTTFYSSRNHSGQIFSSSHLLHVGSLSKFSMAQVFFQILTFWLFSVTIPIVLFVIFNIYGYLELVTLTIRLLFISHASTHSTFFQPVLNNSKDNHAF